MEKLAKRKKIRAIKSYECFWRGHVFCILRVIKIYRFRFVDHLCFCRKTEGSFFYYLPAKGESALFSLSIFCFRAEALTSLRSGLRETLERRAILLKIQWETIGLIPRIDIFSSSRSSIEIISRSGRQCLKWRRLIQIFCELLLPI